MVVSVKIENEELLKKWTGVISTLVKDWTPALQDIEKQIYEEEKNIFLSEGAYRGRDKWKPLSAKYAVRKAKKYPGKTILRATDRLFRSITSGKGTFTKTSVEISTDVPYGIYHQFGTKKMPQRKFLDANPEQLKVLTNIANDFTVKYAVSKGLQVVTISK